MWLPLGLPHLLKPLQSYSHERQSSALGALTQGLVTFLSPPHTCQRNISHCPGVTSQLESCGSHWQAFTGSWKVFLGTAYHHLRTPLNMEPAGAKGKFVAHAGRMGRCQAIFLNNPNVFLKTLSKFNTASLLLEPD